MLLVLVNGVAVPSAPPAGMIAGHVAVPLVPIVTRIARSVRVDAFGGIVIEAAGRRCILRIGSSFATCGDRITALALAPFVAGGVTYVPLADVVRAFGGSVGFDAGTQIVSLRIPCAHDVASPAPFDPGVPQAAPTTVFTPQPAPASPAPLESERPRPRRTAIPY